MESENHTVLQSVGEERINHSFDYSSRPTATALINHNRLRAHQTNLSVVQQSQDTQNTIMFTQQYSQNQPQYQLQHQYQTLALVPQTSGKQPSYGQISSPLHSSAKRQLGTMAGSGLAGTSNQGILKKHGISFQSSLSYKQQISNQSSIRSQENRFRHVQILKNILKQAKKQRKQQKKAKKLDKRKNTFLKRGQKMQTSLYQKTSSFIDQQEEESEEDEGEEIEELEKRQQRENASKFLFMPDSTFKTFWDCLVLIFIIEQSIYVPFQLCFSIQESPLTTYTQLVVDIIFMLDILISFNSGIYHKGILILNRKQVIIVYLKTWFVLDLFSALPYNFIFDELVNQNQIDSDSTQRMLNNETLSNTPQIFRIMKIIRFMRILKLLRVFKLQMIMIALEEYIVSDQVMFILRFAKIMITIIFFAHWLACFYWAVGYNQLDSTDNSWIKAAGIQDDGIAKQYIWSLHWAIQTMCTVGYGDAPPKNVYEQLYVILSEFIAAGVYAYTLNNVSKIVQKYSFHAYPSAAQYREKMLYVNQFLIRKNLPKDLRLKVWRFLQYNWEIKKQMKIEEEEVFEALNQDLKERITVCMNGFILQTIPFFENFINFEPEFTSELTFHTKQYTYAIDDNIFVEGENTNSLYYILSGRIAVLHRQSLTYIDDLIKDDYFGEIAFFTDNPRCLTMKSRDFTDVYIIERDTFLELAEEYEDVIKLYHEINHQIFTKNDYTLLKLECYICRKVGHKATDCYNFHHKKGNLIQIYNRVMRQKSSASLSGSMHKLQQKLNRDSNPTPKVRTTKVSYPSSSATQIRINEAQEGQLHSKQLTDQSSRNKNFSIGRSFEFSSLRETESLKSHTNRDNSSVSVTPNMQYLSVEDNQTKKTRLQKLNEYESDFTTDAQFHMQRTRRKSQQRTESQSQGSQNSINLTTQIRDTSVVSEANLLEPPNSKENQKRERRKSKVYETLLARLRSQAKNPESQVIQEVSEDSLQSELSDVEVTVTLEDNEEEKQQESHQSEKIAFQSSHFDPMNSIFKDIRKETLLLAVVPEENESLYSNIFNFQNSQDSSSRVGGNDTANFHKDSLLATRTRLPSFNSSVNSKSNSRSRKNENKRLYSNMSLDNNLSVPNVHMNSSNQLKDHNEIEEGNSKTDRDKRLMIQHSQTVVNQNELNLK